MILNDNLKNQIDHENSSVESKWPNSDNTELLNTLSYTNYGQLLNSNCCDLSNSNRLALATNKCILIFNFNLDWPSLITNSSPFKFFNSGCLSKEQNNLLKFDSWIRDLNETKNETFYLNIIRNIYQSEQIQELYKKFFNLDEYLINKPKSFNRQLKDVINKNKSLIEESEECSPSKISRRSKTAKISTFNEINTFIEQNKEQYSCLKTYFEKSKIFDSFYYEYLSCLNPNLSNQSINLIDSYKYIRWSQNVNIDLLAALTTTNQLIILDCTKLKNQNQLNMISKKEMTECTNIFDLKTESIAINLTEFWLINHCKELLTSSDRTFNDFILNINKIIPTCLCWSSRSINLDNIQYDLIFVAFKSNEIGLFVIFKDEDKNPLNIKLIYVFDVSNILMKNNEQEEDEYIDLNIFKSDLPIFQITSLSFKLDESNDFYGFLAIGLSSGDVFVNKIEFDKKKFLHLSAESSKFELNMKFEPTKLKSIGCFGVVENVEFFKLNNQSDDYLIVIQKENNLYFVIFDVYKLTQLDDTVLNYHTIQKNHLNSDNLSATYNYLTKTFYKLVDFKLINHKTNNEFEFLLTFENSFIEYLSIAFKEKGLNITKNLLINDTNEIKFNTVEINNSKLVKTESQLSQPNFISKQSVNNLFKMTKKVFFSTNNQILFQINDFTKSALVQKKRPDFHINVYRMKSFNNFLDDYFNSADSDSISCKRDLIKKNDFIWLFKRNFYLNHDLFFNRRTFNSLYSHLKNSNKFLNSNKIDQKLDINAMSYLKRLRILCHYLEAYYQIASSFKKAMSDDNKNSKESENDSDDSESDDGEYEDAKISQDSKDIVEIETSINEKYDNEIIKSSSYYKSMFRELTINLFKYNCLSIIKTAYVINFEKLTNYERLILLVVAEFTINKNFLENFSIESNNKKIEAVEIENWLKSNLVDNSSTKNNEMSKDGYNPSLADLIKSLKCNFCPKNLNINKSNDLEKLVCDAGHMIGRCQKSLLPLNYIKFNKCEFCKSTWNYFDAKDCPNFKEFVSNQHLCLFCD